MVFISGPQHQLHPRKGVVFFKCVPSSFWFLPLTSAPPLSPYPPVPWNVRFQASVVPPGLRHLCFLKFYQVPNTDCGRGWVPVCWMAEQMHCVSFFPGQAGQACHLMSKLLRCFISYFFRWPWIRSSHGKLLHFPEDSEELSTFKKLLLLFFNTKNILHWSIAD